MKYEELTRRIIDEGLEEYAFIEYGTLLGADDTVCIDKNDDGTFSVVFYGERGKIRREYLNIPEEQACNIVYEYAVGRKRFETDDFEKKTDGGMSLH